MRVFLPSLHANQCTKINNITGGAHLLEASPKKLCKALIFLAHVFIFCGAPSNSPEERCLETIVNE